MESWSASLCVLSPLTCSSLDVDGVRMTGPARRIRMREGKRGSITGNRLESIPMVSRRKRERKVVGQFRKTKLFDWSGPCFFRFFRTIIVCRTGNSQLLSLCFTRALRWWRLSSSSLQEPSTWRRTRNTD